jgi:hypothetical protein
MSHRTQIVLTDDLYARLQQESARSGATLAELVRRAVARTYGGAGTASPLEVLETTFGAWGDRDEDGAAHVERFRPGLARRLAR